MREREADPVEREPWHRLQEALAAEYAAGWPMYIDEVRMRLGQEKAGQDIRAILRAIRRAGLALTEAKDAR